MKIKGGAKRRFMWGKIVRINGEVEHRLLAFKSVHWWENAAFRLFPSLVARYWIARGAYKG